MARSPGGAGPEEPELPEGAGMTDAVEQFDLIGELSEPDAEDSSQLPGDEGKAGGAYLMLVEQQLDGIEGDPAELLHNRFKLEERRRLQPRMGGRIYEPRPW